MLDTIVDRPTWVDVHLLMGLCPQIIQAAVDGGEAPVKNTNQRVGSRVKITLSGPSLPGEITPLTSQERTLGPTMDGQWSWEVRPKRPGKFTLNLVVAVLNESGEQVIYDNTRQVIHVNVGSTSSHTVKTGWSWTKEIANGLLGIGTALVALLGWALAVWRWRHPPKPTELPPLPAPISMAEFQTNLRRVLKQFHAGATDPVSVGRDGRTEAVLVSAARYAQLSEKPVNVAGGQSPSTPL
ncbi:type II toxin-antitoxin system Phd/YefM family antitoxin [Kribbella antibiotica]|uniref:Type II toxin-antitoxin system Phd/YefM family antitoxin n=1 Tax=Kribbella antibiotica TaxID=190195 RepID=A0A4R4ZSJ0_9ACTN|nr:type II toxin-antitoxin system Phd/YefM family antitoxin [Kribbella antibiotica]TDD62011.1 type II toxin-antitoxin system Phd/YefM family antitoxin [Kribbella antibiotica]